MCRNIRPLFNFKPPATREEVDAAALQFVRKISGFTRPSQANEAAYNSAVEQIARAAMALLDQLTTNAAPRDRAREVDKAKARSKARFGGA